MFIDVGSENPDGFTGVFASSAANEEMRKTRKTKKR